MGDKLIRVKRVAAALGATLLTGVLTVTATGTTPADAAAKRRVPATTFTVSSFNLLGSSHTPAGGKRAPGTTRIVWANRLLAKHGVDVVGFQEMQASQYTKFMEITSTVDPYTGISVPSWGVYPGLSLLKRDSENSIAWRLSQFDLVQATTFTIPYFNGNVRAMPLVLLREKSSGMMFWVMNVHNPADTKRYHHQQKWRTLAKQVEARIQTQLIATGLPRLFTGDMNERASFYCTMKQSTALRFARSGTFRKGVCNAKRPRAVDWISGAVKVRFSRYNEDRSALVGKTTDHPVLSSDVTMGADKFPRSTSTEAPVLPVFASYHR
jgi:hypothetical protein